MLPLLLLTLSAVPVPGPPGLGPGPGQEARGRPRLVLLDLGANGVDQPTVQTITDVITTAFAKQPQLDVVSAADLRAMLDVEAAKEAVDCGSREACMAELASALGADLLVHGSVGALGGLTIVNLTVFDARKSSAVARQKVQSSDVAELPLLLEGAVDELSAGLGATSPAGGGPHMAALLGGIGVGAAGLIAGSIGGLLAASSAAVLEDPATNRGDKDAATTLYPVTLTTALIGGAAVLAGVGLVGGAFLLGDGP